MKFDPQTEEEIQAALCLPEGEYIFSVFRATDKKSKKTGADMIEVELHVQSPEASGTLFDYLLESMAFKLRHFCNITGLMSAYENGTLTAADCRGKTGRLILKLQGAKDGWPAKNAVKDYIESNGAAASPQPASEPAGVAAGQEVKDDLPF